MPSSVILSNSLLCGMSFNKALSRLAGGRANVRRIVVVKGEPDAGGGVRVSFKRGPFPVYATWDPSTGTVTLASWADRLLVNRSATEMFYGFVNLGCLDADKLDTSSCRAMSSMFQGCSHSDFNPDVSGWDVSNVRFMGGMFYGCSGDSFNPDVSRWDVRQVRGLYSMFRDCRGASFSPDLSSWDIREARNTFGMFDGCSGAAFDPCSLPFVRA